ncbi:MAG: RNA polymerase sigma factor SigZ [Bernardetiaceae bacterium]|nr:RNA polymerase sigma factor SigZ [Bernardetiaceae bacterium]
MFDTTLDTTEIWHRFSNLVYAFVLKRVQNPDDARDIQQDIFLKIHTSIPQLKDKAKLEAWIFQIARHRITDYYRSQKKNYDLKEAQGAYQHSTQEPIADKQELFCCLHPFIQELPERYRKVLEMQALEGLSTEEIATKLSLSVSGVKSRLQRGREMMKTKFVSCCHYEVAENGKLKGEQDCPRCNH